MSRAITLADGLKYVQVISRNFICPKCRIFCLELVPVFTSELMAHIRRTRTKPGVKVFCRNNCHDSPTWGWKEFDWTSVKARNDIAEWPAEWKKDEKELNKRRG